MENVRNLSSMCEHEISIRWKEKEKGLAISFSLYELGIALSILNFVFSNLR